MNEYIGKVCPFCKTEFKEEDEVVVCSTCDMPHHKDCWIENQACTTFGCLGSIKNAVSSPTTASNINFSYDTAAPETLTNIFCNKCGTQHPITSLFCYKCGNKLLTPQASHNPNVYSQSTPTSTGPYAYVNNEPSPQQSSYINSSYNYTNAQSNQATNIDSEIIELLGSNTGYYIPQFQALKTQNKKTTWNWSAFLFPPYWFIYRKMYAYGAGVLVATLFFSLFNSILVSLLLLGGYITVAIFANYIYLDHLEKIAEQAKSMSDPYKTQFVAKNAGIDLTATVLTTIGYLILVVMFSI